MPIFSILYQALYRYFTVFAGALNKGEKDQPAPFDVRRQHLLKELADLDQEEKAYKAEHPWATETYGGNAHEI